MAKTIEVYIANKEVVTQTSLEGRPLAAGDGVHYCSVKEIAKTEKIISEEETATLKLVKKLAAEKGFKIQIIDTANFRGKIRAKLKGVKTTPTIIIGDSRIEGTPKREELETALSNK